MDRFRTLHLLVLVMAASVGQASAQLATAPPIDRFDGEVAEFKRQDAHRMPPRCATLFVGSSSIRLWGDLDRRFSFPIIKRGIGGSTIAEINHYFASVVAPYRPARIVFYAGENDLSEGRSPAEVVAAFRQFMRLKRTALGSTPVYFISAKPSPSRAGDLDRQRIVNASIRDLARRDRDLDYIDIASPMMSGAVARPDIFGPDRLHMNAAGYDVWVKVIGSALRHLPERRAPACGGTSARRLP